MVMGIGKSFKHIGARYMALLVGFTMIVQIVWSGGVALSATSQFYFRGYDAENITSTTFADTSQATISGDQIVMTGSDQGEAYGYIALDDDGHDISTSVDLGSLEIDFSATTIVTEEGAGGAENDVPTVRIDFCTTNYSSVISSVNLAKPDNTVSGSVELSSSALIPEGTRSIMIYLCGANTNAASSNTVIFEDTSFVIHDAAAPSCSVNYNHSWTNAPFTVTVTASDGDSGLEGIYRDGTRVSTTSPYTFTASENMSCAFTSKDYAGKTSETQNVSITNIDTAAPVAPASLTLSHDTWTNTDVDVTVPALGTSSGAPERYIYRLNSGTWTDMPADFTVTDSGQYTIDVKVADAAGNTSSALSDIIYIDKLEPVIDDVDMAVSAGSVEVTVATSDTGLSGICLPRYAVGSQTAGYFQSGGGTQFSGGKFTVTEGGLFTIYVADNAGNYDIGEYSLNTAPTLAHMEDFTMDEDVPENVVLGITDGESALNELIITAEADGTSIINDVRVNQSESEVSIDLTPAANVSGGPVTVTVTVKDDQDETATDTFHVTVQPVNDDPVALDDEGIVTSEDTSVKIDVLANDTDTADGDTLTISDSGTPQHGTTAIAGGQIRYTPAADYTGDDYFVYTISDGHGGTAQATVFISATAVNDAPVAADDAASCAEDGSVLIDVLDNDTDIDAGDTIALVSAASGTHGTAAVEEGQVRYTPSGNFFGEDTFTYVIEDAAGLTDTGSVTVTVTGEEDAPYYSGLNAEYTIDEDDTGLIEFSICDVETPADTLMLQAVSLDEDLVENGGISITGLSDDDVAVALEITPVANSSGDVTISLALGDGFSTVTQTFVLHITNINDAPTAKPDKITYTEDAASVTIEGASLVANDTDIEGDTLHVVSISFTSGIGTMAQLDADTWEYTPQADYDGDTSFTYVVSDNNGGEATGTCTLTATPVNDGPSVSIPTGTYSTNEDTESEGITFTISDEETAAKDLIVTAGTADTGKIAANGLVVVNNEDGTCTLTITPAADAYGNITVRVTVSDGSAASTEEFTFTINPMPDTPVAVGDKVYVPISGRRTFTVTDNDRDADGQTLTVVADSWLGHSLNGELTFNEATQEFTYRAANGENGTGTFTYQVTDGTYVSLAATVTLTINSMTHAPAVSAIASQYASEDGSVSLNFTVTDEDLHDTATVSVSAGNTTLLPEDYINNIKLTDNGGGSYTLLLKPAANQYGSATVTVTATDSTEKSDSTQFTLYVTAYNDAPEAANDTFTVDEDNNATLTLLANDTDPEGDTIWVNAISWPSHGWLTRSGANYIYTPYGNWNGTETLSYSITDGQVTDSATATITVTPVNDAPVNYSNWQELPNEIGQSAEVNVLSSDYDPDTGDTVRLYEITEQPAFGTATMDAATGKITYTRTSVSTNSNGADQVKYRIIDRETATGDYRYADAYLYIGIDFFSSLYSYSRDVTCYEDDGAFTFDLSIHNPNSVDYDLTLSSYETSLGTFEVVDDNTVRFTPLANQNGTATISFTATETSGEDPETTTSSIYLRIYPVNDAPVIDSAPDTATCGEDSAGAEFTVTFHDPDCAAADLYFYAYATNAESGAPVGLTVDIDTDRSGGTAALTVTPAANANGTLDIAVVVSDGITQANHTVHMTVNPADDAPVLSAVNCTLYEDMDVTFEVITPDCDVDGDDLIVSIEAGSGPEHGTAIVNEDGTITYTPNADYYGEDSLTFTVTDDTVAAKSSTQTASFTVTPVNDQPVISNLDYYQNTQEDTPKDVTLTVTDVDNDLSEAESYTITSSDTGLIPDENIVISQVSGYDMKITLTPEANRYGSAVISVIASDGELTAEAQFQLTVAPVNDTPSAAADTASKDETVGASAGTTSVTIDLTSNDTDVEDTTLQVVAITDISAGSVTNNKNGTVTYSVNGDWNGTATFNYTVMDDDGATSTAGVTVVVAAQNDPPRAQDDALTIAEDTSTLIAVLENDTDVEGDALTITDVTDPTHGTAAIEDDSIRYTPNENYYGSDSFTYTISDGGGTDTAQVSVTITAFNDAPAIAKYAPTTGEWVMDEDTAGVFNFTVSDPETATENLIITIDSKSKSVIKNTGIVLSTAEEGNKVITVRSQPDQYGTVPVEFKVTDGVNTTTVTWNITISPVNDAPVIPDAIVTTKEDTPVSGSVTATDAESDTLIYSAGVLIPAHGDVTVNEDGSFTYTPDDDYTGEDYFSITVSDGEDSDSGTVYVTVTPLNDKPVAIDDASGTAEDTPVTVSVLDNDEDADLDYEDVLTVVSVNAPSHGAASISEDKKTITYTPAANWNGEDTFYYTVKDSDGETDTAKVTVTVSPANDAPDKGNIDTETDEDTELTIALPDDIDIDEATNPSIEDVVITAVDDPAHGTASISADNKRIIYMPDANWYSEEGSPETFQYTVRDAGEVEAVFAVTVDVSPVNDAPVFTANPADMELTEDLDNGSSGFTVSDVETAAGSLSVTLVSSSNTALVDSGDVTITAGTGGERTVEVNPNDNRNGTANIKLRVTDADDAYSEVTFTVTVAAANDAPSAQNDTATTNENEAATINVLANDDIDLAIEGDTLTLLTVSGATYGTTAIVSNKAVYTPDATRTVTASYDDTFTYTMKDASGAESGATVTVTVTPVNDAPVITDPISNVTGIPEDSATGTGEIAFTVTDEEDDDDTLAVTYTCNNTTLFPAGSITITNPTGGDGTERTVQAIPAHDMYGTAKITLTVTDSGNAAGTEVKEDAVFFYVTVDAVDDPLGEETVTYTVVEDVQKQLMVLDDADVDDPAYLTITSIVTPASHGTVTIAGDGKSLYYKTELNGNENDTFVYRVRDGFSSTDYDITANITVTPVNDAPVVTMTEATSYEVNEGVAQNDIPFTVTDVDNDIDTQVTLSATDSSPILILPGGLHIDEGTGENRTIDVTPNGKWNGTATVTITASDGALTGSTSFTFIVKAVNEAPVAVNDTLTAPEDALTFLNILANDTDGDETTNPAAEYMIVKSVTDEDDHAVITITADGSGVNIDPNDNWNGTVTFTYVAADAAGAESNTATVTVTVTQVNDAPVADDETVTTNEDTAIAIDVLDGDTDIDQDETLNAHPGLEVLSVSLTGALKAPDHGSVSIKAEGKVTYTPAANYNGPDSFEYFVTDGETQDKGLVTVTVTQVNDQPAANADSASADEDTYAIIDVMDNDTDIDTAEATNQDELHYSSSFSVSLDGITTQPLHGDIEVTADNKVKYTPDSNWYGTDTFTYWIRDGHEESAEGSVTVTVGSVNDLPVFTANPADMELTEDGLNGSSGFTVSDVETLAANLVVTCESSTDETLADTDDVTITPGVGGARTVTVDPKNNQNGTADIVLRVTDGSGGYAEYTFTVTVAAVNDAPVGNDTSDAISEDSSYTVAWTGLTSDVDIAENEDSLSAVITTQAIHGTAVVDGGNIIYTPADNWNGTDSFVYTVTDEAEASDTGTITITVNQVNDAPVADDETATTNEDTGITVDVLDGDTDIDQDGTLNASPGAEVLSASLTGSLKAPDHGSVSITAEGDILYTPAANYNGPDSFEYFVTDGEAQDKGLVSITVKQVNDPPVANPDGVSTDEDVPKTIDVLANDTDIDTVEATNQDELHYRSDFSVSLTGITNVPDYGDIEVTADNKIIYTPDTDWCGTDTFTYWLLDGHGKSDEGTVTIEVGGENDPPVAVDDTMTMDEDEPATVNVLENDTDEDVGDTKTFDGFIGDTDSLPGTIEATADGDVTFTPDADYNGSFTIEYQVADGGGLTDVGEITITVNPVNDVPQADSFSAGTSEDTAKAIDTGDYISDADIVLNGDSLAVTVEDGDGPAHGSVSVVGDVATYTPAANYNGTDSFTITVTDEAGVSGTGVITVTVAAVNDAPIADDDEAATDEDTAVMIDALSGDTDVDTDTSLNVSPQAAATLNAVGSPLHGDAVIKSGQIEYTPDTDWNGEDSFTYTVSDGTLADTGVVTVTVSPVNDAPEAADDTAETNDEDTVSIDVLANDTDVDTDAALNADPDSRNDFEITEVGTPANGVTVIKGGKIEYTPNDRFAGIDSFAYAMSDGHGGTSHAAVTVTVHSVNDPPDPPIVHTPAGGERYGGESTLNVTWSGFDIDGDALTYTLEYYDGVKWNVVETGLDDTEYDFDIPETLTSITNLQFRVNASDAEFTGGYGYSGKVHVDKSIPMNVVVTMKTADGKTYTAGTWTNQSVTVTAVSVEDASKVVFSYSIEDKVFTESADRIVTTGVHTVYITATDEFGNAAEFGGYLVKIDKQPPAQPSVTMETSGAGAKISFALKSDPGGSGNSNLTAPDGKKINAASSPSWTAAKNGTYTFKLYDTAGNVTVFDVTVSGLDESAPVITCDSGDYRIGDKTELAITAALSFTDNESQITAKGYMLNESASYSGAYKSYTSAIEITEPGTYYLHAYARNEYGQTAYKTFGPFIIAAANPDTGGEPGQAPPAEVPLTETPSDVIVDAGDVAEISEGAVKVRTPGGEWTDTLTLEGIEPGTYIIEVMDENGNIKAVEITITDEQVAAGQWKPGAWDIKWYVWAVAGLALGLLMLLIILALWHNVTVAVYDGDGRKLRSVRRRKRRDEEVTVTVSDSSARGGAWGVITLSKPYTKRMRGNTLIVKQGDTPVLRVMVPEDADGRFEAEIDSWVK